MADCSKFRRWDLAVAALVLAVSTCLSVLSYASIRRFEEKPDTVLDEIPAGKHDFCISRRGLCIGRLTAELTESPPYELRMRGEIRAAFGHAMTDVQISSQSVFDAGGRLEHHAFALKAAEISLSASAQGINPIELRIDVALGPKAYHYDALIPGPILLEKNPDSSYRAEYAYLPGGRSRLFSALIAALRSKFSLARQEDQTAGGLPACPGGVQDRLDIAPLINMLNNRIKNIEHLLGGEKTHD